MADCGIGFAACGQQKTGVLKKYAELVAVVVAVGRHSVRLR